MTALVKYYINIMATSTFRFPLENQKLNNEEVLKQL